jgi:predicted metal-dependent hydrolase
MRMTMTGRSASEHIEICWGERRVTAELLRTERRALRIDVRPTGEVTMFAPAGEEIDEIMKRAHRKCAWIFAQIDTIAQRPKVTPQRRFISGETHLMLGRQYRLSIEQSDDPHVRIDSGRLVIGARTVDDQPHCRRLLQAFYSLRAREVFQQRFEIVLEPFLRRGLKRPPLVIRPMSKRWGSFTPNRRVVLNVDLVRASPRLIDYVICHELAHAFYPDHGKSWRNLLDTVMPDWMARKAELESSLR